LRPEKEDPGPQRPARAGWPGGLADDQAADGGPGAADGGPGTADGGPGAADDGPGAADGETGSQPAQGKAGRVTERRPVRAGRNLPAAIAVSLGLGGLALLTLFTVKATFLLYVGAIVGVALWELSRALRSREIRLPVVPIAAGGAAMFALAYFSGAQALLAAMAGTIVLLLAWLLPGGSSGYLRDLTAAVFTVAYLPLMAAFVALMLARPDGARRALLFLVLTVCSDVGGYFAGILIGRHPMAQAISPKKTWEGLGGSAAACLAAGAILLPVLLHGKLWQGLVLGAAAVAAASLGDLAESMIKRDLAIKDMGSILPGHGGILDRIDSLLVMAPVIWLLLAVFIPNGSAA
jgi:phosphatidate cytidylyltransferase